MKIPMMLLLLGLVFFQSSHARINFLHIPKTGGTTIDHLLRSNFAKEDFYPERMVTPTCINTEFCDIEQVFRTFPLFSHEVISGHFPIWFFQEKDREIQTSFFFTVLREPVDRVLSNYQYWKAARKGWSGTSPLDVPANQMCTLLSSDPYLRGEELLADAIANLERMDYLVFFDDFEGDIIKLFSLLNLSLEKGIPTLNKSQAEFYDDALLHKIYEKNLLDVRLYEYAKKHYQR